MPRFEIEVEVANKAQADAIERALQDDVHRASAIVFGMLAALPTDRARRRVMSFVVDVLEEQSEGTRR